jgi:hypothetical protein
MARNLLSFTTCLLLLVSLAAPATAQNVFTEDFSTTEYLDAANTSLIWDTVAGEIGLGPFSRTLIGNYLPAGPAVDVVVSGDYAYLACVSSGVSIVDISDPGSPALVSTLATNGYARALAVNGRYMYVANNYTLMIFDISNPQSPALLAEIDPPGNVYGVEVDGNRLYMANDLGGVAIADVSVPSAPVVLGSFDTAGNARDVAVAGDMLYVAIYNSGLAVIDISDPSLPVLAASLPTNSARAVAVHGDHLYVADHSSGVLVIDISNPTSPTQVGVLPSNNATIGVCTHGDYLLAADYGAGLMIADISDPTAPVLLERLSSMTVYNVVADGNLLFFADYYQGLKIYEIAGDSMPVPASTLSTGSQCTGVAIAGDFAYLGINGSFTIVDITDFENPQLRGSLVGMNARDVAVTGNLAYVAATDSLYVVDISDPDAPVRVGAHNGGDLGAKIQVEGSLAFLTDYGFDIFDISDPTNPVFLSGYLSSVYTLDSVVKGDRAYITGQNMTYIVDISDPSSPSTIGTCYFGWSGSNPYAYTVEVAGGLVFMTTLGQNFYIFDADTGSLVGAVQTPFSAYDIAVSGNRVFLASNNIEVIDITNPADPLYLGSVNSSVNPWSLAVSGNLLVSSGKSSYSGLEFCRIMQEDFNSSANRAQSLDRPWTPSGIAALRVTTTQTNSVFWEISTTSGNDWLPVEDFGQWLYTEGWGRRIRWRSSHHVSQDGVNPTCSELTIEWLLVSGEIRAVSDIPDDQGGRVRVEWSRSGYDVGGLEEPVVGYEIYRQVTESYKGDTLSGEKYPSGNWDFVKTVPAHGEDEYSTVVPTLADSTVESGMAYSTFFIRSTTADPFVFYDSAVVSGYSLDNLAPEVPSGFLFVSETVLAWEEILDEDFQYCTIYGSEADHLDGTEVVIGYSTGTEFDTAGHIFANYLLTATDFAGNESSAATTAGVSAVENIRPLQYALHNCTPNPFNPSTTIHFDLPQDTCVTLRIYDVAGNLVLTLANGEMMKAGQKRIGWQGQDDTGRKVAAGVYFYRLDAGSFSQTKRMTLVK